MLMVPGDLMAGTTTMQCRSQYPLQEDAGTIFAEQPHYRKQFSYLLIGTGVVAVATGLGMTWAMHKYLSFSSGPVILLVGCVAMVVGIVLLKRHSFGVDDNCAADDDAEAATGGRRLHTLRYARHRNEVVVVDFAVPAAATVAPPRYSALFDGGDAWRHQGACACAERGRCRCEEMESFVADAEDSGQGAPPDTRPPPYESVVRAEQ
ncbi:PREDICTED: uncharacterized protein LOC106818878 [Priapulus caudatus]|uniref:Uncharacterized protein LOC106818878 n=1 Tax=Priapulus caudatus TaxID=37621 RepID=A0ABM1F3L3_PRICU|nr:PREDICTED: uncharacterized protein LOC106818878 [Priapulus caudatus]